MYNTMICSFPVHLDSDLRRSRFQLLRDMEKNQKLLPNTLMIFCHSDVYKSAENFHSADFRLILTSHFFNFCFHVLDQAIR